MNPFTVKIEVPDPPSGEPESYCRFCYSTESLISIFPATGNPHQRVIELLKELIAIELNVLNDFPSAICNRCYFKLEDFDFFRRQCTIYHGEINRIRLGAKACSGVSGSVEQEQAPKPVKLEKVAEQDELLTVMNVETVKIETDSKPVTYIVEELSPTRQTEKLDNKKKSKTNNQIRRSQPKDYRCRICLQFFTSNAIISGHVKTHMDTDKNQCLKCSKTFKNSQGLIAHMRKSYISTSFTCKNCDVPFKSKEELFAHESTCDQDGSVLLMPETPRLYQCDMCPKSFQAPRTLYNHKFLHTGRHVCDKCGTNFIGPYQLKNHNERYHAKGEKEITTIVKCEPCQQTFVDATAYRGHLARAHQYENNDPSLHNIDQDKQFECDHCGQRFWSINTLRGHIIRHRQYRDCDQCSESFRSAQQLKKHKFAAHPVKCQFCPKKYSSKQSFRSHANIAHGMIQVKLVADDGAGVTYMWRKLAYRCAACEKEYDIFRDLKDHCDKMHAGEKAQIKCPYCDRLINASKVGYVLHVTGNCGKTPKKLKAWN